VVAQSPEPEAHDKVLTIIQVEVLLFDEREKLRAKKRTNNKLNQHMPVGPGIEPGTHWWEASALTPALSLLPQGVTTDDPYK